MKKASALSQTIQLFALTAGCCAAFLCGPAALANPSAVALWRFDENGGTNVTDSTGLGNNGVLQGENGHLPSWVPGQNGFGSALQFINDGVNHSYVSIPGAPSLLIGQTETNGWSITAWAYESSDGTGGFVTDYGRLLAIDDGVTLYFDTATTNDQEMYTWSDLNPAWQLAWAADSTVTPLLDQWVHWAMVYDGTNLTLYRNANQGPQGGMSALPVTAPLAFPGYTGAVLIGTQLNDAANDNWNGMLDDIAIFAGALTQAQVATVMSGDFSSFLGGPPGIVSQPLSQTVPQGSQTSMTVGADGAAPFHYQWYYNGTNQISSVGNPTAATATLVLSNLQLDQSGTYSVTISNSVGHVTSQPLVLSVFHATLVGLWRFNEADGTNILDSSGLGNTGTLQGENGNVPGRVPGQAGFGNALSITNDDLDYSYASIPANGSLLIGQTATNAWTITAWAYEDSEGTGDFVAISGRILVIDDGVAFQLESGSSSYPEMYTWARANQPWQIGWGATSPVAPLLDQWVHWAVVYDGTNLTLYRNGNQGTNGGVSSQLVTSPLGGYFGFQDAITIGSELAQPPDRTWNGKLDDVAIFNIALSQSEIQTVMGGDFSAYVPKPPLTTSISAGNIVLSWPAAQATFQLQSATDLASPGWANVTASRVPIGGNLTVTLPLGPGTQFFRLVGP